MADKLTIKGMGQMDGDYDADLLEMSDIGEPGSLNTKEAHYVKLKSGVRQGELRDALVAWDAAVLTALAVVVMERAGKRVDEDKLWDAPTGTLVQWTIDRREEAVKKEDEELPPASAPPESEQSETPSQSGGASSSPTSEDQESGPSPIGPPALLKSVTSGRETLAS